MTILIQNWTLPPGTHHKMGEMGWQFSPQLLNCALGEITNITGPIAIQIFDPMTTSIKGKPSSSLCEIQNGKPNLLKWKEIFNKLSPAQQVCWSVPDKMALSHGSSHYHCGTWLSFHPRRFLRWPTTTHWWSILTAHSQYGQRGMGSHKSEILVYFSTSDIFDIVLAWSYMRSKLMPASTCL